MHAMPNVRLAPTPLNTTIGNGTRPAQMLGRSARRMIRQMAKIKAAKTAAARAAKTTLEAASH